MQNLRVRLPAMAAEEVEYLRDKTAKLSGADVKARQSSKIRELGEALITAGFVSLDAQARVLGLPRSTAWTILSAKEHRDLRKDHRSNVEFGAASPACSGENHPIRRKKQPVFMVGRRLSTADLPRNSK